MADDRARLAAEQARLVAALTRGADAPADFDAARLRLAAESLAAKRRRSVARAWPALAALLGESFAARFDAYAAETPLTADTPAADGRSFARWLDRKGELPEPGRIMLLASDLVCARPLTVRTRWLAPSRRLAAGIRLPWWGVRLVILPFGKRDRRASEATKSNPRPSMLVI